jgi:Tol biopolymer transport system component
MSKVDDELTRRFHRAERPVADDGLFEGLERRRSHRERIRKVQVGVLGFAVVAVTVAGFAALRAAFEGGSNDLGNKPVLPSNGDIVFVKDGQDDRLHIYAARPDGSFERQLTDAVTNDSHPAVSPDGRTVAFAHELDGAGRVVIATVPIGGGAITWLTDGFDDVTDPAWSPDGTQIAFIGYTRETADLMIADVEADRVRRIDLLTAAGYESNEIHTLTPSHPTWSPDGRWIAFSGIVESDAPRSSDLARIHPDGSGFEWLAADDAPHEFAPAWSPDGRRIAFIRTAGAVLSNEEVEQSGGLNEIWTVSPDGDAETLIAQAVEASLGDDLTWAPDASALLISDHDWLYRVDPAPVGDVRENFVRLFRGFSPSWQPIPAGAEPPFPSNPEPSMAASPAPEGRDIGLGVRICDLESLPGIDWDGTGIDGTAWTGAPVDQEGTCTSAELAEHVVAVDRDGDGLAEQGSTSTLRSCLFCQPFDTVDLNDDGVLELVVLEEASSTPTYSVFEVNRPGSERAMGVYPIIVVPPGAPSMNLDQNEPVRFTVGGDEGFSGSIECEDAGGAPILRYTWVRGAVDADTDLQVDISRLRFGDDGVFHIESVDSFSVPRDPEPTEFRSTEPACGVDFHPDA